MRIRETYHEPTNLYTLCVGYPGSGKSQAYRMATTEPLETLDEPFSNILVDDYTKRGLFKHLQEHKGRALLAHEEMGAFFDLVQKRQLEGTGERQLYCRLYDAGQWVSSTAGLWQYLKDAVIYRNIHIGKKTEGREETKHNCVCINGFIQPQPFLTRYYPQLTETVDGLADRLLVSFPKTHILMEEVNLFTTYVVRLLISKSFAGSR